jgi:hypothetical protein
VDLAGLAAEGGGVIVDLDRSQPDRSLLTAADDIQANRS